MKNSCDVGEAFNYFAGNVNVTKLADMAEKIASDQLIMARDKVIAVFTHDYCRRNPDFYVRAVTAYMQAMTTTLAAGVAASKEAA